MPRRLRYLACRCALLAASVATAAAPAVPAAPQASAMVAIGNFTFDPPVLKVAAGTTVTWVNHDDIPHTATSATKRFGSPVLDTDEHFAARFDEPGSYPYFCKLHPHMSGMIEVMPAAS